MTIFPLLVVLCGVVMGASGLSPLYKPSPSPFCPPEDKQYGFYCRDSCSSDSDCGEDKYCCSLLCGKTCMGKYQATYSPNCPEENIDIRCVIFLHNCINDDECKRDGIQHYCCPTVCGNTCNPSKYTKYWSFLQ